MYEVMTNISSETISRIFTQKFHHNRNEWRGYDKGARKCANIIHTHVLTIGGEWTVPRKSDKLDLANLAQADHDIILQHITNNWTFTAKQYVRDCVWVAMATSVVGRQAEGVCAGKQTGQ